MSTTKVDAKGIIVSFDRIEGTNDHKSVELYDAIAKKLEESFSGLRVRYGVARSTLKAAGY